MRTRLGFVLIGVLTAAAVLVPVSATSQGRGSGIRGYEVVRAGSAIDPDTRIGEAFAWCPGGKRVLGGGVHIVFPGGSARDWGANVRFSAPVGDRGWTAQVKFEPGASIARRFVQVYAVCAFARR